MATITEYPHLFRDLDNPNRFYRVMSCDHELATLRAFSKFGKRITSLSAEALYDMRVRSGFKPEVIEWRKE